jgi:LytS/YehU family sensor histidine kinase
VENAVKHGMTNNSEPLKICIGARIRERRLVVEIANTGRLDKHTNGTGTHIGLRNVRERLAKLYPDKSSFSLRQDGAWIRATIEIEVQ